MDKVFVFARRAYRAICTTVSGEEDKTLCFMWSTSTKNTNKKWIRDFVRMYCIPIPTENVVSTTTVTTTIATDEAIFLYTSLIRISQWLLTLACAIHNRFSSYSIFRWNVVVYRQNVFDFDCVKIISSLSLLSSHSEWTKQQHKKKQIKRRKEEEENLLYTEQYINIQLLVLLPYCHLRPIHKRKYCVFICARDFAKRSMTEKENRNQSKPNCLVDLARKSMFACVFRYAKHIE